MATEFCLQASFHAHWVLLHVVNLRHGTDGFTSPLKEGILWILSPLKSIVLGWVWTREPWVQWQAWILHLSQQKLGWLGLHMLHAEYKSQKFIEDIRNDLPQVSYSFHIYNIPFPWIVYKQTYFTFKIIKWILMIPKLKVYNNSYKINFQVYQTITNPNLHEA
jgi:hypothetical protein